MRVENIAWHIRVRGLELHDAISQRMSGMAAAILGAAASSRCFVPFAVTPVDTVAR